MPGKRAFAVAIWVIGLAACGKFLVGPQGGQGFPPPAVDAATDGASDAGDAAVGTGPTVIRGVICVIQDVRDYRTCATGQTPGVRVTIEETGAFAEVDANGEYALGLAQPRTVATLIATDKRGVLFPGVVRISVVPGIAKTVAVPMAPAQVIEQAALNNGVTLEPSRGVVLAYAVEASGLPVTGARATVLGGGIFGPYHDGQGPNEIAQEPATHGGGLVTYFGVPPSMKMLKVEAPVGSGLKGDTFDVPVRSGKLTFVLLVMPKLAG